MHHRYNQIHYVRHRKKSEIGSDFLIGCCDTSDVGRCFVELLMSQENNSNQQPAVLNIQQKCVKRTSFDFLLEHQ